MLMASPNAEGLFHRAIAQSLVGGGTTPGLTPLAQAEQGGLQTATEAGVTTAAELRAMSAEEVTAALGRPQYVIDHWAFPEDPAYVFAAGRQHPVDFLFGSNKDDSLFSRPTTAAEFAEQARSRYGELAADYLAAYPYATDEEASASSIQAGKDQTFWGARAVAEYQRKLGKQAYVFYFAQNPPGADGESLAAAHASEVPYVFNNLGQHPLYPDPSIPALSAASAPDRLVADRMSSYWVNFARTGNPNGDGLPHWPAHSGLDSVDAIILDAEPEDEALPRLDRMRFFDALLKRSLAED
jgi:para-nitrobenzyl esterase